MSIHRPLRNEFSNILVSFLCGSINNDEAADALVVYSSYKDADIDRILDEVFKELDLFFEDPYGSWTIESMMGQPDSVMFLARVACFLNTDLEYEPSVFRSPLLERIKHPIESARVRERKLEYWPFPDKEKFDIAWKSCSIRCLVEGLLS